MHFYWKLITFLVLSFHITIVASKTDQEREHNKSLGTPKTQRQEQEENDVSGYLYQSQADDVKRKPCFGVTSLRNLKNIKNKQLRNRCKHFLKRCFSAKSLVDVKTKFRNKTNRQQPPSPLKDFFDNC